MILNLDTRYKNPYKRLEVLEQQFEYYEMYGESMILTSICTLLIKGSCTEQKYFKWYEKAVESELKIAQLYEYYMASA